MSVQVTIDGQRIQAEEGEKIVNVAADNDVYIPTLCYHRGKPCLGTCRVCSVKVNGRIMASCTIPVSDGMVIEVNETEIADMRKALVELLFSVSLYPPKSGTCREKNLAGA